jgi:hypothetical protein
VTNSWLLNENAFEMVALYENPWTVRRRYERACIITGLYEKSQVITRLIERAFLDADAFFVAAIVNIRKPFAGASSHPVLVSVGAGMDLERLG